MGTLTPAIPMTYETINGITYSKQVGSINKVEIGYKFDPRTSDGRPLVDHIRDDKLWANIRARATTHAGLQSELDRVIMFYNLIKPNEPTNIMWHPV